jgi:ubiquinone/menaquinone biosynthesis C-methylase UbiE
MSVQRFYDQLAPSYHLVFEDWQRSIERQRASLSRVLRERWGLESGTILDAAVGIGTQSLGLATLNFTMIGADLSAGAVSRARREAAARSLRLPVIAADFRELPVRTASVDAVIACDNALPHLLSLDDIRRALSEFRRCARPGGAVVISMRDYASPLPSGTVEYHPYGERKWNGHSYFAEQEWHWNGPTYNIVLRVLCLDSDGKIPDVTVETTYLAVPIASVLGLMRDVGLVDVQRLDDVYYQPLLLGTAPPNE